MSYKVKLHPDVVKFLEKLPKDISERMKNRRKGKRREREDV